MSHQYQQQQHPQQPPQYQQATPVHYPSPAVHQSPVAGHPPPEMGGAQTIKRNGGAFAFYLVIFILFAVFASSNILDAIQHWHILSSIHHLMKFAVVSDIIIDSGIAITLALGAFKKDWLLTGNVALKLSPIILGPVAGILLVAIFFKNLQFSWAFFLRVGLYFLLAFVKETRPYSYVNQN